MFITSEAESFPPPALKPARAVRGADRLNLLRDLNWALSLFLVGVGAKFFLIFRFGTSLPFLDQWDAEARALYLPYLNGKLSLSLLFQPHVEHRIFFTRIYDLVLFLLNGQWDGRLQMVTKAVLHCAAITGLGWLLVRLIGRNLWPWIWLPLALALALPFAWENTLAGFQSQFYFLLIFSTLTIWLLGLSEPLSVRWWLGVASAIAALFTTGSGVLASAAVFVLVVLDMVKEKRVLRRYLPVLAVCTLIGVTGILLKPHVPQTDYLKAHSSGDFLVAFARNIAWPRIRHPYLSICNLLPLLWLAAVYLHSRKKNLSAEKMILGMSAWVFLQAMAAAYSRGIGGAAPASRYMDSSSLIMMVNWLSFACLLSRHLRSSWFYKLAMVFAVVWAADCLLGLWQLNLNAWNESIPERRCDQRVWLKTARAFLATDDPHVFDRKRFSERLHPRPQPLASLLRQPQIRHLLPACVRNPLRVIPANLRDATFVPLNDANTHWDTPTGPGWISASGTNVAGGHFESRPLGPSSLPYLEFPVAGDFSTPGVSLGLLDLATGRTIPIRPSQSATEPWQTVSVKAPVGKFEIVAANTSQAAWFAFKEPREVGRFSEWAVRILAAWKLFLLAGLACLLLNVALLVTRRRQARLGL
ncbi:MAG: hypothetical protein JWR69_3849 [Pedosphaera sp.]|nr:hypothetical protein [Pedosphaera sp.]